jgi:hypothetical protein
VFPLVLFFVLIGLMMLASMKMTQQGRVQKLLPIERPILADQRKLPAYQPMFPPGPRMREGYAPSILTPLFISEAKK